MQLLASSAVVHRAYALDNAPEPFKTGYRFLTVSMRHVTRKTDATSLLYLAWQNPELNYLPSPSTGFCSDASLSFISR